MAVTPDTIAIGLGRDPSSVTDEEEAQWEMWIDDSRMLIAARLGDLDDLDQAKLDYVVREAVISHIRHPDDATQVSVSIDDGATARTYRSGKGRVVILDEWWDLLSPGDAETAFTVDMIGFSSPHPPWCDLHFGGTTCSCGISLTRGFAPIYEPWP